MVFPVLAGLATVLSLWAGTETSLLLLVAVMSFGVMWLLGRSNAAMVPWRFTLPFVLYRLCRGDTVKRGKYVISGLALTFCIVGAVTLVCGLPWGVTVLVFIWTMVPTSSLASSVYCLVKSLPPSS